MAWIVTEEIILMYRNNNNACYFLLPAERPQNKTKVGDDVSQEPTWVHEIFQGILTSETRCLNCETVSYPS